MTQRSTVVLIVACFVCLCLPTPGLAQDFKVVVNDSNPIASIQVEELSRIFLKQTAAWPGGLRAHPIDQTSKSECRQRFSLAVHKRDVNAIRAHWQRMVFSGRAVQPVEKETDAEVLDAVRSNAGAVGYVSSSTSVGEGVKTIEVEGI